MDHIHWIEETAKAMGIPLDDLEDTSWMYTKMAEKERKHHEEAEARIAQYNTDIDTHPIHEEARQFIPGMPKNRNNETRPLSESRRLEGKPILQKKSNGRCAS